MASFRLFILGLAILVVTLNLVNEAEARSRSSYGYCYKDKGCKFIARVHLNFYYNYKIYYF